MRLVFATTALLAFLSVSSTAPAQRVVLPLTAAGAQAIAAQSGLGVIYRLRLDEGVWKIEGRDLNGQYVYMRIDPTTGQIVRFDRSWW
jgi:hypothetical protein